MDPVLQIDPMFCLVLTASTTVYHEHLTVFIVVT